MFAESVWRSLFSESMGFGKFVQLFGWLTVKQRKRRGPLNCYG